MASLIPVFDLDGTLIDSDEALVQPFLELGIAREDIAFGLPAEEACIELGVSIDDYVRLYDEDVVQPYDEVEELIGRLERWAVCSNKHPVSAAGELARLGWKPEVALFTDAFEGRPKELQPVLDRLGVSAEEVLFVGDTDHDRRCAEAVGASFAWAGWNPRCAERSPAGVVLRSPLEVLRLL